MRIVLFFLISVLFYSCNNSDSDGYIVTEDTVGIKSKEFNQSMENVNIILTDVEDEEIDLYTQRHNLNMNKTGTGLRYLIYKNGTGECGKEGEIISLKFTLNLINGIDVYDSETEGLKKFLIGKGGVESGLEEIALIVKKGDKAKVIIPSYLGYGLLGDEKKIPKRATLIYDVEVLDISEKQ